jgi:TRAP-type C4-dicarboxylate transport system permease small subunit
MRKAITSTAKVLKNGSLYFVIALGIIMLVIAIAHVVFRYAVGQSLRWSEEFLKIALVWFCLISASLISHERAHLGIVIFREKMPQTVQWVFERLVSLLILGISVSVTIIGFGLVASSSNQFTPAMGIPYSVGYLSIPLSFILMGLYEIRNLYVDITDKITERKASSQRKQ